MDGMLPPVDTGGWLSYQRRRAQQYARERIARAGQIGQVGGDWLSRAGASLDDLIPDWAQQEAPRPNLPQITPIPSPSLSEGNSGVLPDWARRAGDRIGQIGGELGGTIDRAQGIIPSAAGLQDFSDRQAQNLNATAARYAAERPELPMPAAVLAGAGGEAWQGLGRVQDKTEQAVQAMTGFGPQGADLPAQAVGAFQVGTTPFTVPGEAAGELAGAAGGLPETQAAAQGVMNTVGPGGTIGSIRSGLAANAPKWLQQAPIGLAAAGAGVGVGTGIAAGAPPAEVLTRGFEGANLGAGVGEAGATLLPGAARAARGLADRFGTLPGDELGVIKRETYDPTGINPVQGRLAAQGKPGRAPGPAMLGPITPQDAEKYARQLARTGYGAEYTGPSLSSEPFPPGPGPNGEYVIPHPTGPHMVAAPPEPGTYLSSDGVKFWNRVISGQSPYAADWQRSLQEFEQPKYPWDVRNSPPPAPGSSEYGRLPGIEEAPLVAPDWDARLAGWRPRNGTDPDTLRHLLNRYATAERFPREAVDDLAPSHPDLGTPEARMRAEADLNEALNRARARRSKNEDRAIASERNTRDEAAAGGLEEGGEPTAAEGHYSYTSKKGVTPDGTKGGEFHLTSSYEVASAIKFDMDPNVVSYQKGAGPRGRVRILIDPKYGYNPNSEALMANSDPGPGSETIFSPDWLVTFKDGSQKVVETKNAGIVNIPAWRIGAKSEGGQRHFEDMWGVGFMMMAEDQLGRPFLQALSRTRPGEGELGQYLARIRPGDLADLQKKLRSAANASRGGTDNEPRLMAAAQHLMDLNSRSKYPASADLDDTRNVEQYLSAARAQAEWHNASPEDGTTFSVDGQSIPLAPGLGGYMVGVTPTDALRNEYPTHRLDPYRLAQFRHENADIFELLPDARVGTYKGYDKGLPVTYLDVAVRAPDGQAAAEAANLFRQRFVYNIDSSTNVPLTDPSKQWVGRNDFTSEGAYVELQRILDAGKRRIAAGGKPGGEFPADYRSRGGAPAPTLGLPPRARAPRAGAAGRRGTVPGVLGAEPGGAQGARALEDAGGVEPSPGGGLRTAAAPELPADGRGSGIVGGPGGAGGDWRSALSSALATVQPYGAARTSGERAFDVATGTAGGVLGAATAPEDATWQERAKRFAVGSAGAALAGPTARGALGQLARNTGSSGVLARNADEIDARALGRFGRTRDLAEGGYLQRDGTLLDLSGKAEGGTPGMRSYDHREAGAFLDRGDLPEGGTNQMLRFMENTGAVRVDGQGDYLNIQIPAGLTAQQRSALLSQARGFQGAVVEITDATGRVVEQTGEFDFPQDLRRYNELIRSVPGHTVPSGEVFGAAAGRGSGQGPKAGGLTKLGAFTQAAQAVPLMSPKSLATNAVAGGFRLLQRYAQDAAGNLDRPGESVADLLGMFRALPDALGAAKRKMGGLTQQGGRGQGIAPAGLFESKAPLARFLTSGTRANAATDQFYRTLAEGGARARQEARGAKGTADAADAVTKAGDFISFTGPNSPIANGLVTAGQWANDASLPAAQRILGATAAAFAPYVRTPERVLRASVGFATDPATQPVAFLRALKRGDETARREATGRFLLAAPVMTGLGVAYLNGQLRGDPPANPTERRRQEAQGARWNTLFGIPTRQYGNFGQAAAGLATAMAAGERALLRGEHPADVGRDVVNATAKWVLSESYLEDLVEFGTDVSGGRASQAIEKQATSLATRPLSPLTGFTSALDPNERAREGAGQEALYGLPGGRFLLPERLDPATGEPIRRKGNFASRYFLGDQGREVSPEGTELNRYGVNAPEYRAGKEYQGAPLTGAQARIVQRASGSEINKATRETLASPEYKAADEEGKEKLLRAALSKARERADIVAGGQVGRGPTQQARREYDAVPKYRGVSGTEDQIRTKNDEISRAKSARSAAKSKGRQAEADWIKAHPDQYALTRYEGIDAARLKAQREKIEQKYGVELG